MIHQPSGRGYHDLRVLFQLANLPLNFRAAIDNRHADVLIKRQQAAQFIADLNGKLARGRKDQSLQFFLFRVDVLNHRNAKSKRLTGAGRRFRNHIFPLHQRTDGLGLNACGVAISLFLQRL